ncbi:alcohol dehydrogenase catalytic domain-containing protein [bacterium]|nr:alcohol dehydrogenase catalytic domain-containing protein [bacterium]
MRALVWDGSRARVVADVPDPIPVAGECVVRVLRAGICSTDLEILGGYLGFRGIPGHEFVGRVEQGPADLVGTRVVGEINFGCGRCEVCAAGRGRHCPSRSVLGIVGADGAFADRLRIPSANLHRVPESLDDDTAVFVEPLAAAFRAGEQTAALAGGRSLVIGAGKLGLLVAQVLRGRGDRVVVLARRPGALRLAESLGLAAVPDTGSVDGFDLVVDASGSPDGLAIALRAARPLGTIVVKTTVASRHDVDLAPLVIDEVTLVGSRCGPFPPAVAGLASGAVTVAPLVEATFGLGDAIEALRRAGEPGARKILLDPGR